MTGSYYRRKGHEGQQITEENFYQIFLLLQNKQNTFKLAPFLSSNKFQYF